MWDQRRFAISGLYGTPTSLELAAPHFELGQEDVWLTGHEVGRTALRDGQLCAFARWRSRVLMRAGLYRPHALLAAPYLRIPVLRPFTIRCLQTIEELIRSGNTGWIKAREWAVKCKMTSGYSRCTLLNGIHDHDLVGGYCLMRLRVASLSMRRWRNMSWRAGDVWF